MNRHNLHRYILGSVGLFVAFAATLPIAMMRVSQTEKFAQQPFHSLTCDGKAPDGHVVVEFQHCTQGR